MSLTQCFGDRGITEVAEGDIVSAVEFDSSGDYIATGDRAGRVVLFKCQESLDDSRQRRFDYRYYTEFQSHETEFDYLKSLEIEEKINQIKWSRPTNNALFLLSTNDKTIKLWKVHEKKIRTFENEYKTIRKDNTNGSWKSSMDDDDDLDPYDFSNTTSSIDITDNSEYNHLNNITSPSMLKIPKVKANHHEITSTPKRIFEHGHDYHINSISINNDGESFLSADDLRINLWNIENCDETFNIVDIKPEKMEELTEVITAAVFHPSHCNLMMYSSSRGIIKLADLRQSALCDSGNKVFEEPEDPFNRSFFSEIIASISDIQFTNDGRFIISRDFMTLKVWDINMDSKPIKTIKIHEDLRDQLCDIYECDSIFDKFECAISGDGSYMLTGSYNNLFHVYDRYGSSDLTIEVAKNAPPGSRLDSSLQSSSQKSRTNRYNSRRHDPRDLKSNVDYTKKVLNVSWHPEMEFVAIAGLNKLCLYSLAGYI